jgi:hypothetical protein
MERGRGGVSRQAGRKRVENLCCGAISLQGHDLLRIMDMRLMHVWLSAVRHAHNVPDE